MKTTELSPVEARLIQAFRRADERAQYDAMYVLEHHPDKTHEPGEVVSIDSATVKVITRPV